MKKQKGLGLIGALLIIGALILTAGGVVVWQRQVVPMVTPTPTPSPTELPFTKPTGPSIGEPKVGQGCTYDHECSKLGRCTLSWPLNCWIGKCVDGRCVLEKVPTNKVKCQTDTDCILIEGTACLGGCESCEVLDYSSPLFAAFNKDWCQKNQPEKKACLHCDIQRTNIENFKAKCISGVCQKVR